MRQMFLTYGLTDPARVKTVSDELTRRGFRIGPDQRNVLHAIQIRVRDDTHDRSEVEEVIASLDPGAKRLPDSTPANILVNYRDGR